MAKMAVRGICTSDIKSRMIWNKLLLRVVSFYDHIRDYREERLSQLEALRDTIYLFQYGRTWTQTIPDVGHKYRCTFESYTWYVSSFACPPRLSSKALKNRTECKSDCHSQHESSKHDHQYMVSSVASDLSIPYSSSSPNFVPRLGMSSYRFCTKQISFLGVAVSSRQIGGTQIYPFCKNHFSHSIPLHLRVAGPDRNRFWWHFWPTCWFVARF